MCLADRRLLVLIFYPHRRLYVKNKKSIGKSWVAFVSGNTFRCRPLCRTEGTGHMVSKEKPTYSGYGYHGGGRKPTGLKRVSFCVSCQPEAGKTVSRFLLDAVLKD